MRRLLWLDETGPGGARCWLAYIGPRYHLIVHAGLSAWCWRVRGVVASVRLGPIEVQRFELS